MSVIPEGEPRAIDPDDVEELENPMGKRVTYVVRVRTERTFTVKDELWSDDALQYSEVIHRVKRLASKQVKRGGKAWTENIEVVAVTKQGDE